MNAELHKGIIQILLSISQHRDCEDGYYACPKSETYFGSYESTPIEDRPCHCFGDDASQLLKDMGYAGRLRCVD